MSQLGEVIKTPRLELCLIVPSEAEVLSTLVKDNIVHLESWMTWASQEQHKATDYSALIHSWDKLAAEGTDFHYGVRLIEQREAIVGVIGVHDRVGPKAREIGYWIDHKHEGNGFVAESVRYLTEVCLRNESIDTVVIKHEKHNSRSRNVPNRLGFVELGPTECSDGRQGIEWIAKKGAWKP